MSKLERIKNGLKCWDDHLPPYPPKSKHEEMVWEELKRQAQLFHQAGIDNVRYLLSHLELATKALERAYGTEGYAYLRDVLEQIKE